MSIAIVTLFVSLVLATGAVLLFIWAVKRGESDYSERLALLPLDDDAGAALSPGTPPTPSEPEPVSSQRLKDSSSCDR